MKDSSNSRVLGGRELGEESFLERASSPIRSESICTTHSQPNGLQVAKKRSSATTRHLTCEGRVHQPSCIGRHLERGEGRGERAPQQKKSPGTEKKASSVLTNHLQTGGPFAQFACRNKNCQQQTVTKDISYAGRVGQPRLEVLEQRMKDSGTGRRSFLVKRRRSSATKE
jgi:hypothetical protein